MFYQFNHLGSPDYIKVEHNTNFSFPPHLHQCFEVVVVLEGSMDITVDDKTFTVCRGEAVLIFPNQIHALASEKSKHMLSIFSPQLVQAYTAQVTGKIPVNNKFTPDNYLINALTLLEQAPTVEKKGILYLLCGSFDRTACYTGKQPDKQRLLYKIFSFVEEQFSGDCSLMRLAGLIGYDYVYVSRYFKKATGISFNTYVNHYRLSHACYLLENTTLNIIECAFDSGYTSLRSFNRSFKEYLNCTPTQYRKSLKKEL